MSIIRPMIRPMMRPAIRSPFFSPEWSPVALFDSDELGAFYLPKIETLKQDSSGTLDVGGPGDFFAYVSDLSGNSANATSATASDQRYMEDGPVPYIDHTTGSLSAPLPDMGLNATSVFATWAGLQFVEGQALSGPTTLPQDNLEGVIYIDRALTQQEKALLEKFFDNQWLFAGSAWSDSGRWRDIAIWEDSA